MAVLVAVALTACGGDTGPSAQVPPGSTASIAGGGNQTVMVGSAAPEPLTVAVEGPDGTPLAGVMVTFTPLGSNGSVSPAEALTSAAGIATTTYTAGTVAGLQSVRASIDGLNPLVIPVVAQAGPASLISLVAGDFQSGPVGQQLPQPLRVRITDAFANPLTGIDVTWAVTLGSGTLNATTTTSGAGGFAEARLTLTGTGTARVAAAAAGLSGSPVIFHASSTLDMPLVHAIPYTTPYHDQYVRDGIAFLSAWDDGLQIYDIGGGGRGGTPAAPVYIGGIVTAAAGVPGGPQVHNAWWYHSPSGQKRYVFVGQEGPGVIGTSSSGDLHVVDVSNMAAPVEVASFRVAGAGAHNFWVDEQNEILYVAYYNGGVVALNVSGTLSGNLASREIARIQPGGAGNTYMWGVQLVGTSLYATDMLSGFWQLRLNGNQFQVLGGGNNVNDRFGSDLWLHGGYAYTGTIGQRAGAIGNMVKIWQLNAAGAPVLADSIITTGVFSISDVEVSADGKLLMFSAENGPAAGIHFYDLTVSRTRPRYIGRYATSIQGVHTATFAEVGGRRYVIAARNNPQAAIFLDVTSIGP